jgi:hypothetical protein
VKPTINAKSRSAKRGICNLKNNVVHSRLKMSWIEKYCSGEQKFTHLGLVFTKKNTIAREKYKIGHTIPNI